MLSSSCLGTVLVLVLNVLNVLTAPAPLPGLRWKFKEGEVFYIQSVVSTRQAMTIQGAPIEQRIDQTITTRYTVKRKNADGSIVLEQTILAMKVKQPELQRVPLWNNFKGATFLLTLDAKGEVTDVKGYKEFLARVDDDGSRKLLPFMLTEESLKQSAGDLFSFPASKRVFVGDTWRRQRRQSMGPMGELAGDVTYRYVSKASGRKGVDTITWSARLRYLPAQGTPDLPFKVTSAELKPDGFEGKLSFDPDAGRLVETSMAGRLKGKMTILIGQQSTDMDIEQSMQTTSRLFDKPPGN
jgi:hypothetical protein